MRQKILYLYSEPAQTGIDHIDCHCLVESLKTNFDLTLAFGIWPDEITESLDPSLKSQVISESALFNYNVLFLERGLGYYFRFTETTKDGKEKTLVKYQVNSKIVKRFFDSGGIIIYHAGDIPPESSEDKQAFCEFLKEAALPPLKITKSIENFPEPYGYTFDEDIEGYFIHAVSFDKESQKTHGTFWINITSEYLNRFPPKFHSIYDNVSRLLVFSPYIVSLTGKKLLMGNIDSTRMLAIDLWWDGSDPYFGMLNDFGNGCAVTITGRVFSDRAILMGSSDALTLANNIIRFLLDAQAERAHFLGLEEIVSKFQLDFSQENQEDEGLISKIIEQIHQALQTHPDIKQSWDDAEEFSRVVLKDCWNQLETSSKHFLISGESIFRNFRTSKMNFDFAAVAIEFSKVLEEELNSKLIKRFAIYLDKSGKLQSIINSVSHSKKRSLLVAAINPTSKRSLTLGQISVELENATKLNTLIYQEFNIFLHKHSQMTNFWLDQNSFLNTLRTITTQYRNSAAHRTRITLQVCSEFRSMLYGIEQKGLLCLLVQAMPIL